MNPTIYKIEFPNGQFYIGCTCNFSARRQTHLSNARKKKAVNQKLQAAFDAYPICAIYEIASGFSRASIHELEQQIMDIERPPLNVCKATPVPRTTDGSAKQFGPYDSIAEFARHRKITYRRAKYLAANNTFQEAVDKLTAKKQQKPYLYPPDPRNNQRFFFHDGEWLDSVHMRKTHGIGDKTYKKRRAAGWGRYEACTKPLSEKLEKSPMHLEALTNGVRYSTAYRRVKNGWSVEDAVTLPNRARIVRCKEPNVRRRYITSNGVTLSLDQWAAKIGTTKIAISGRLCLGWTEAQAIGAEPPPNQYKAVNAARAREEQDAKRKARLVTYKGFTGTLTQVCREFGAEYTLTRSRLRSGWTTEEAFEGRPAKYHNNFERLTLALQHVRPNPHTSTNTR